VPKGAKMRQKMPENTRQKQINPHLHNELVLQLVILENARVKL
jgi:hypothetical protein